MLSLRLRSVVPRAMPRLQQLIAAPQVRQMQLQRNLTVTNYSKRDEVASQWEALRANPNEWFDNRLRKTSDRQPDFVNKNDRSMAIWVDSRDTPEWFEEVIAELDASRQSRAGGRGYDDQAKWESLRDNPQEWHDNRYTKTNPKAPDFKRKDDKNVVLWVNSAGAPEWLPELLSSLDSRSPRGLAGSADQPAFNDARRAEELAKWEALRSNPSEWFDNRARKEPGSRKPDFVLKTDRTVALWINSRNAPEWMGDFVAQLEPANPGWQQQQQYGQAEQYGQQQQYGQQYGQQQQQAYSYGAQGRGGSGGDRQAEELAKWESLRTNPQEWYDNRYIKTNPKAPDFKRKDDRNVALWVNSYNKPDWADELLANLDQQQAYQQRVPV